MQHRKNLYRLTPHAISHYKSRPSHDKLAASVDPARTPHMRKRLKPLHGGHDPINHIRSSRRILRLKILMRRPQILERANGPAQLHRSRQTAAIFFTLL